MTDRTTKLLLAVIAAGLWANAAVHLAQPAIAQGLSGTDSTNLARITDRIDGIFYGSCANKRLCSTF